MTPIVAAVWTMIAGTVEADFNLAAVKGERHFQYPASTKGKRWADDAEPHNEKGR